MYSKIQNEISRMSAKHNIIFGLKLHNRKYMCMKMEVVVLVIFGLKLHNTKYMCMKMKMEAVALVKHSKIPDL